MSKVHNVNFSIGASGGAQAIFELKQLLVNSAGWSVTRSGTGTGGTTAPSDLITTVATLTTNDRAWFVIKEPAAAGPNGREWCFQRVGNNETWRVKISPVLGFQAGGGANFTPTANNNDEGIIVGGGTDLSPTGAAIFTGGSTFKVHIIADDTPYGPVGNVVYPFWMFTNYNGSVASNSPITLICQEPLAIGSYPPLVGTRASTTSGEADPAVYACIADGSNGSVFSDRTRHRFTETDMTFEYFHRYSSAPSSTRIFTFASDVLVGNNYQGGLGAIPSAPFQDPMFPLFLGRSIGVTGWESGARTTSIGYKGTTQFIRRVGTARANSDTTNLTTDARIYLNELLIPWPENVTPSF